MTLIATTYCTEYEVERFLSSNAVIDFSDHDQDGTKNVGVVDDCINQATEEIDLYARQRYDQAQLATSTLINRWSVVIAARFLCQRRGNPVPDSIESEWLRIADPTDGLLLLISKGKRQLPGIPLRADLRPTWSNLAVDRRYQRSTIRVTETNSSDAATDQSRDSKVEYHTGWD